MTETEIVDYYHTGKYALEYMTSIEDILVRLKIGDAEIKVCVDGEAHIVYKDMNYFHEHELNQDVIRLIGKESKKLDVRKEPEYKVYFSHPHLDRRIESLGMSRLPSPLTMEEFLRGVMKSWLQEVGQEQYLTKEEKDFLEEPEVLAYQVQIHSHIRKATAFNQMESFINSNDDIVFNAGNIKLEAEEDNHGRKWLSVSYQTIVPVHQMVVQKMKEYGIPER